MARALGFASANAAVEALELSGSAVALLNRSGEVLRLNRTAESLLGLELRVVKRRLVSHDQNATIALDRALQALLWSNAQAALMPPVAFPRRGKRSLLAYPIKAFDSVIKYLCGLPSHTRARRSRKTTKASPRGAPYLICAHPCRGENCSAHWLR